jgi:hypothetical protein
MNKYGFSLDPGDGFRGLYQTRTDAIYAAMQGGLMDEDDDDPCPMYTARAQGLDLQEISLATINNGLTREVQEECQESIFDIVGGAAEGEPPGDLDQLRVLLQNAVQKWLEQSPPNCWQAVDVQYHTAEQVEYILDGGYLE